jgi:S-DNA-T family DNA segregation ATPase FtsK/SpoIIIE
MKTDSKPKKEPKISRSREIFGLSVMILGLFLLVGLVSFSGSDSHQWRQDWARANWGGPLGDMLAYGVVRLLGYAGFMLTAFLLIWGWIWLRHKAIGRSVINSLLMLLFTLLGLTTIGLLHISYYTGSLPGGGLAGSALSDLTYNAFGPVGGWLIIFGLFLILLLVGTEVNFQHWLNLAVKPVKDGLKKAQEAPRELTFKKKPAPKPEKFEGLEEPETEDQDPEPERPAKLPEPKHSKPKAEPKPRLTKLGKDYQAGLLALLEDDRDKAEVEEEDKTGILLEKLQEFGIEGEITDRYTGPVVTRYEFKPAPGVKVNQISNLSDDLALAMQAHRIRILAPIPGKGVVGIEIPNHHRKLVMLKDLFLSGNFKSQEGPLTMALGKTITGDSFSADLSEMPHMLIAGSTGSGKSVCLNTIITSLLYLCTPEDLHFIMIDPKRIELSIYRGIPHLQFQYKVDNGDQPVSRTIEGVVTDSQEVVQVFRLAVSEMDARYRVLAKEGCRNISDYNRKSDKKMSYLLIVIDELADLMLSREASEIESRIAKLAQMSRAVGIHLILATQRPSVDVITGVIKANFPARIAFQVASKTDSRTVLDANGAETLLGRGDMLYMPPGKAEPQRLHGPFISTAETEKVVNFIKEWYGVTEGQDDKASPESRTENNNAEYSMEVALPPEGSGGEEGQDELFEEAKALVVRHQQGSVSLLQRRLKVGYSRAARLIDQLEAAKVVGPFDGSKAREVLIKNEEAE